MKLNAVKTILLLLSLLLVAIPAGANETLTNRSVERMVSSGLNPEIIISKIKGTKGNFDVTIDKILALKDKGIDDNIIKAMVEASSNQNVASPPRAAYNQGYQYYEPGQSYEPAPYYSGAYRPQKKRDPIAKMLIDLEEASELKEKGDPSWKPLARSSAVTLKTIYRSNTHNIKYWWAYAQYSVLVEKQRHINKALNKILHFDANHVDALILKGDLDYKNAKKMRRSDDDRYELEEEANKSYQSALNSPKASQAQRAKVYYKLGELTNDIKDNKSQAKRQWKKAIDEAPNTKWANAARQRLGIEQLPPSLIEEEPSYRSQATMYAQVDKVQPPAGGMVYAVAAQPIATGLLGVLSGAQQVQIQTAPQYQQQPVQSMGGIMVQVNNGQAIQGQIGAINMLQAAVTQQSQGAYTPPQAAPAAAAPKAVPADNSYSAISLPENSFLQGRWQGSGTQTGMTWTVKMDINDKKASIEYPSLQCGGSLSLLSTDDNLLQFHETITYGNRCLSGGKIEFSKESQAKIKFVWLMPDGEKVAEGSLHKL